MNWLKEKVWKKFFVAKNFNNKGNMKRVTGIGGLFFKCKDPKAINDWYAKHLGFPIDEWGCSFINDPKAENAKESMIQWSPFKEDTEYFVPSEKAFMFNYTVENLEALVIELKKEGVTILDEISLFDYGKFVHILDCENNKIELWEPA